MCNHGYSKQEHQQTDSQGKVRPMGPQSFRPIIYDSSYERFHKAELAVYPQQLETKFVWTPAAASQPETQLMKGTGI